MYLELTESDLCECSNILSVANILDLEELGYNNNNHEIELILPSHNLKINEIIDLTNFDTEIDINTNEDLQQDNLKPVDPVNLDYYP
ncbi:15521_t:CDS:2 [Funneliformis geosporum]|uniref:15521_t:CDS:1 n=1 Tax=Funneliformis geosporum TaxID=1117311 RepID=A0A9W4SQX0_9GLOM|nr:15521_t:CDS:2 [Funneliformis geosporum]